MEYEEEEVVEIEVAVEEEAVAEEGVKTLSSEPAEEVVEESSRKKERVAQQPARKKAVATALPNPTYVSLKALIYLAVARNSGSVSAVQTRLLELGYTDAGGEKQGWFGPRTYEALLAFQADEGIDEEYCAGEETIAALFAGTHVEVHNL
jgi:peptidoglycan hydrolase-like protein with peptidoglycan-binding domain